MKKFSAPPMIIILDVLFVVLFVLVLEESPNIKIVLPKDKWLQDTIVVSENKNKKINYYFNYELNDWETIRNLQLRERTYDSSIGDISCTDNKFCLKIKPRVNETRKIYIKGNLYDEVSGLIADSCLRFPKECVNVTYYITAKGRVDRKRLKEEHQIFRYILKEK